MAPRRGSVSVRAAPLLPLLLLLLLGPRPAASHGGKYSREKNEPPPPTSREPGEEFRMEKLNQLWEKARRVSGPGPGGERGGAASGAGRRAGPGLILRLSRRRGVSGPSRAPAALTRPRPSTPIRSSAGCQVRSPDLTCGGEGPRGDWNLPEPLVAEGGTDPRAERCPQPGPRRPPASGLQPGRAGLPPRSALPAWAISPGRNKKDRWYGERHVGDRSPRSPGLGVTGGRWVGAGSV